MSTMLNRDHKAPKQIAIPVLTPDRENKRQNGRRFKDNMEPMFTLTAQDIHGVAVNVKPEVIGGIGEKNFGKQYREGNRVYDGTKIGTALKASGVGNAAGTSNLYGIPVDTCENDISEKYMQSEEDHPGIYVELYEGCTVYAVWYEKYGCYIAIRKLTPKECFRLQGWTDDYYEKAEFVNSNTQLYKQAGKGVTVNVVYEIAKAMKGERH